MLGRKYKTLLKKYRVWKTFRFVKSEFFSVFNVKSLINLSLRIFRGMQSTPDIKLFGKNFGTNIDNETLI